MHQLKGYEAILSERCEEVIAACRARCEYFLRTQHASRVSLLATPKLALRRSKLEFVVKLIFGRGQFLILGGARWRF